ncbi:hypothetical protein [Nonomuraea sp. C10]|uniref:hypothetical protein n=1 Tax=Nonomuraea sp. C10 TaxID=2600577 RepID=UPI0011CE28DE|nr:hypothetical protein [Nonomuraea sp. C10]TXK35130.1 hypothetical protein FR742_38380 [Nonomuraea sp. C10]
MQQTSGHDLSTLRASFPGWSFFRSDTGAFYATRRGVQLNDAELDAGLQQTVSADDADTFVALLHEQHLRGWGRGRANT